MPNLTPPVTTVAQARAYRERILAAVPDGDGFSPLMTLYLTDETTPETIREARASGLVLAAKLYPAGATTNSAAGVTDLERIVPALTEMEALGLVLAVHGEVTAPEVDIFDREARFLDERLEPLARRFPALRIVLEHVTTAEGVAFVQAHGERVAGTLTPQHLLLDRNDLLVGGLKPHHYCLPVLKRGTHRAALLEAVAGGDPSFFAGTDSAPHARGEKECACGCAGCFSAPAAVELYAEAFDRAGALAHLPAFLAGRGARFYGLPPAAETVQLRRETWTVPESLPLAGDELIPLWAGQTLRWKLAS